MAMLNEIKDGEIYRHISGTLVKVLSVTKSTDKEDSSKEVRGVTFVEKDHENEMYSFWMTEETFGQEFYLTHLYPGIKVLMISMGKVLGETELEETEDENILRAKHAGELFRRFTTKDNRLQMVYCPKESSHIGFTIAEIQTIAAKRQKVIADIQKKVRELESKLESIGELSNIDIESLRDDVNRRIDRTIAQIDGHDDKK